MPQELSSGEPIEYWFNLKTGQVEFGKQTPATYRVGPFATEVEARQALKLLAERSRRWSEEEKADD